MSEASKQALKRGLSPTHELMMDWILQNPGGTLREMGAYFNYSVSWLSTVMQTDAFKAYAAERLQGVHAHVTADIPAKMRALAELSIERMTEMLFKTDDADVIKDSFDKVMNRYGYAPGSQKANPLSPLYQQNNVFFLSPEQMQRARQTLIEAHSNAPSSPLTPPQQALPAAPETASSDEPEKVPSGS